MKTTETTAIRARVTLCLLLPLAVLVGLCRCSKRRASAQATVVFAPPSAPPPAGADTVPAPTERKPVRYEYSAAKFADDDLTQCWTVTYEIQPADAGDDAFARRTIKTLDEATRKNDKKIGLTRIAQPCSDTFADRVTLASCTTTQKTDVANTPAQVTIVVNFHDFGDVGLNDAEMRDCMSEGGDWIAVRRDTREWAMAKLAYDARKLRKLVKENGRQ